VSNQVRNNRAPATIRRWLILSCCPDYHLHGPEVPTASLACAALGIARTQRLTVVAQGPIIEAFIEKRPEFQDLLGLPTNGLCAAIGEQSACRVAERLSARRTSHNALQLWKSRP
jgi:hypothetical protein